MLCLVNLPMRMRYWLGRPEPSMQCWRHEGAYWPYRHVEGSLLCNRPFAASLVLAVAHQKAAVYAGFLELWASGPGHYLSQSSRSFATTGTLNTACLQPRVQASIEVESIVCAEALCLRVAASASAPGALAAPSAASTAPPVL